MRALAIALLFSAVVPAREIRGTILGRVTDPTGAAVPGAAIVVINVDTNVSIKSNSNIDGNYQVPFLPPGN